MISNQDLDLTWARCSIRNVVNVVVALGSKHESFFLPCPLVWLVPPFWLHPLRPSGWLSAASRQLSTGSLSGWSATAIF